MARRTKEDSEKTREALLDAAEIVFMRRGVGKASLEEIASEANVTRGAVYWHFENKLAIFRAMHDRVKTPMDLLYEELVGGEQPLEGLKKICIHAFNCLAKDKHVRNVMTITRLRCEDLNCSKSEYALDMRVKRVATLSKFTKAFHEIGKTHAFAPGVTPAFAANALHSFISGVFWDYLRQPEEYPIADMAPTLVDCFFRGLIDGNKTAYN